MASLAAFPGQAGINFAAMPVGCTWTMAEADDDLLRNETYLGPVAGGHRTEVTGRIDLLLQRTYDTEGRLVREDKANGKWQTFSPYNCLYAVGRCTHRVTTSDGASYEIEIEVIASGDGFKVRSPSGSGQPSDEEYFETGVFGIITLVEWPGVQVTLVGMSGCDLGS